MERPSSSFWGMVALGVAIVLASIFLSGSLIRIKQANDTITVKGSARSPIVADHAVWRGRVEARRESMQAAYSDIEKFTEPLKQFLKQNTTEKDEINFLPINSWEIPALDSQGRDTGKIAAYNLAQQFTVSSDDVESITRLVEKANRLILDGIPVQTQQVEYLVNDLPDLRVEMLAEATKDARNRAEVIAGSAGGKIGSVRSVQTGVFQITQRNSTQTSDWGMYDTTTRDKDIMAVVTVTFSLK